MNALALPTLKNFSDATFNAFMAERAARGTFPDTYPVMEEKRRKGPVHQVRFRELFTEFDGG